jgi:flavin-dependent dehydrogenase
MTSSWCGPCALYAAVLLRQAGLDVVVLETKRSARSTQLPRDRASISALAALEAAASRRR